MSRYPILVARYKGNQSLTKVCEDCNATGLITVDEINQDDIYECPAGCPGVAVMKYVEADFKCPNCGKLGFEKVDNDNCCSRACSLQWDYAKLLAGRE